MIRPSRLLSSLLPGLCAAALGLLAPGSGALAGETACWFEHGVVVAPASVMGIAGDYIVDTATPATQVHADAARAAGFSATALTGEVRLAGLRLRERPVAVADLDYRGWPLPVPLAGVIGADVLKGYVVDLRFAPCRLRLSAPGRAPRFRTGAVLPIRWTQGRPTVDAAVSDGPRAWAGAFAVSTGADAPIRLSDAYAAVPGAARPQELYVNGVAHPRLRALSLAGALQENLVSGLEKDQGAAGVIGAAALSRWRLRFNFPAGVLAFSAP